MCGYKIFRRGGLTPNPPGYVTGTSLRASFEYLEIKKNLEEILVVKK